MFTRARQMPSHLGGQWAQQDLNLRPLGIQKIYYSSSCGVPELQRPNTELAVISSRLLSIIDTKSTIDHGDSYLRPQWSTAAIRVLASAEVVR